MVTITLPSQTRARLRDGVLDYFANQLTVMDRDILLSLVDHTLDYLRDAGMDGVEAQDVLRRTDDGLAVEVTVPSAARFRLRTSYRAVRTLAAIVVGLHADPGDWVTRDLPRHLAIVESLRRRVPDAEASELLELIHAAVAARDQIFTSRRRHFLGSFAVKIAVSLRPRRWTGGRHGGPSGRLADSAPSRRFQRRLDELRSAWRSPDSSLTGFARQWAETLDTFGGRGESFLPLVSDRTWDVDDSSLRAAVENPVERAVDVAQAAAGGSAAAARRARWVDRRLDALATERDWVVHGYEQATRVARLALLRLGQQLADYGALHGPRDVMHLRLDELEDIVAGRTDPADLGPLVAARRERYEQALAAPAGPMTPDDAYGDPDGVIEGFGASPGRFVGAAHVVRSLEEAAGLQPGAILVCRMTSPSWVPLLAGAGAVVTDRGGVLSHAAIVARELGIPTVTGTRDATRRMLTGRVYEVDADHGTVRPVS